MLLDIQINFHSNGERATAKAFPLVSSTFTFMPFNRIKNVNSTEKYLFEATPILSLQYCP